VKPLTRLVLVAVLVAVAACGGRGPEGGTPGGAGPSFSREGRAAAHHFLDTYVTDDGRVLRHDQGGDIVSEGQAYGMLIAELVGEDRVVRNIWRWTREHLARPDGLLSFHADAGGRVLDQDSATDADTLAAYVLLRYDGDGESELRRDGRRLADAVLAHETVRAGGGLVPVAGSWAAESSSNAAPYAVNPSYWMPGVAHALAGLTGDERWDSVASTTVRLVGELTDDGEGLPPDWAELSGDHVRATGAPDGSRAEQYGLDAQRVPVFFEAACGNDDASRLAAAWWRLLRPPDRSGALALAPDGTVIDGTRAPLPLLAAAAAARAADEQDRAAELISEAATQARAAPTYYGDAWLALAAGLAERQLGC
jgi:endo-1,4-beta-D-glucanase Y